jgi:serine/threonine protein kinase, bacterial
MIITHLNNRYQVIQILAEGGFGQTFLAEDTYMPSRRRCVIKQLKLINNDPQAYQIIQQRFEREAATLEYLGEHNIQIPKLYAYFLENGQFYLVQEWIQGQTLRDVVTAKGYENETLVREIIISLLSVLDYVHSQGIIHRDIKPDNIILRSHDSKPVLIDFGAVKETIRSTVGVQGNPTHSIVIGTPGYMPSEQAVGRPVYATDIYSLGLTAIYLLTGKNPIELQSNPQTGEILWQQDATHVSPAFASILSQAIEPQASDRFNTAREMLCALQSLGSLPKYPNQSTQSATALFPGTARTQRLSSSPKSAFIPTSKTNGNWQKPTWIFGGLVVSILISGTVLSNITHQSQSETTIAISPTPESTQESTIINSSPIVTSIAPTTSKSKDTTVPSQLYPKKPITSIPSLPPPVAYTPEPQVQPAQEKSVSISPSKQENQQKIPEFPKARELSPSVPSISQSENLETVVPSQKSSSIQPGIHKGYCTLIAINKSENIVDNPCSIHDNKNGNYKLIWSNGKESYITSNPNVSVDNAPASIIRVGSNHMTVQGNQGKIGFCWNCNP